MKTRWMFAVLFVCSVLMCSCGGGSGSRSSSSSITPGNWAFTAVSTVTGGTIMIGGNVTQSGDAVSGLMHVVGSDCFDPLMDGVAFSGNFSGDKITLKSLAVGGQVITVNANASGKNLIGTYSISGGCAGGDYGNVGGNYMPPVSGTWKTAANSSPGATVTLVQTSTPDAEGRFPITGNITMTGSPCFSGGAITNTGSLSSFKTVWGTSVLFLVNEDLTDPSQGSLLFFGNITDSANPVLMSGGGEIVGGPCAQATFFNVELTKQ